MRYRRLFFAGLVLSVIFYSIFITQQLTNTYDGIWLGDYLSTGAWEVSIGRCMLIYLRIIAVLHMQLLDIPPADYMGADSLSIGNMILSLPESIGECYQHFYRFFLTDGLYHFNTFQRFVLFRYLFAGFMLLAVAVRLAGLFRRKHFVGAGLVAAAILVLPIACDLSMLFAPEAGYMMQQTFGLFMVFPCVLCLIGTCREDGYTEAVEASEHEISEWSGKDRPSAEASSANVNASEPFAGLKNGAHSVRRSVAAGAFALLAMFFIYGNAWQCNRDIMAMDEGRTATRAMLERMVDDLIRDGLLSRDRQYAIMGRPADNKTLFVTSGVFDGANAYARYGEFWTDTNSMFMYYQGLLRDISVNMHLVNNETYEALRNTQEVKSMPAFPAEGSIREINGGVVVKLG